MQGLGRVRTAINLGFIIGPAAGGYLAGRLGQSLPAIICVMIYCLDFFMVFFMLPESNHHNTRNKGVKGMTTTTMRVKGERRLQAKAGAEEEEEKLNSDVGGEGGSGPLKQLWILWDMFIGRPAVRQLIAVKFLLHLAMAVGRSNYSLFVSEKFGLTPEVLFSLSLSLSFSLSPLTPHTQKTHTKHNTTHNTHTTQHTHTQHTHNTTHNTTPHTHTHTHTHTHAHTHTRTHFVAN